MRTAFKEWLIVVDALGRGDQILILRKGGISEDSGTFQVDHPEFVLFPTLFHQQRDAVIPQAQARYDDIAPSLPDPSLLRIEFLVRVVAWKKVQSLAAAERLKGQHIWRDEVIAQRYEWGGEKAVFALATRVYRLPRPVDLPMLPAYGGCKSWVELEPDLDVANAQPVLSDSAFSEKLKSFEAALGK